MSHHRGSVVTPEEVAATASAAASTAAAAAAAASPRWRVLLPPNFDERLKSHAYAASFGHAKRALSKEPGFEVAGQLNGVHAYSDPNQTSFLKETRSAALFSFELHAPTNVNDAVFGRRQ